MSAFKICRCLSVLVLMAALGACSDDQAAEILQPNPADTIPGVSLIMTPDTVSLEVGDSVGLTVRVANTSSAQATFRSSNQAVATVSQAGKVIAIAPGTALVTATSTTNAGASDGTIVSVRPLGPPVGAISHLLRTLGVGRVREEMTSEVAVAGNHAYTGTFGGNQVYVWNVQTPSAPALLQQIVVGKVGNVSDMQVSEDQKLVIASTEHGVDAGMTIFSRAADGRLQIIGSYRAGASGPAPTATSTPGSHTVKLTWIKGRHYAYLVQYTGVQTIDITDPTKPVFIHHFRPVTGYTHDVIVRDGLLFTADWDEGAGIYDVGGSRGGAPANPVFISRVKTVNGSLHNFWWMQDQKTGSKRYLFGGEEGPGFYPLRTSGDIHVIDISDITKPREVAFLHVDPSTTSNLEPAGPHNFHADEQSGILYAAYYNGGVRAIDTRGDLSACEARQRSKDGRCDLRLMGREVGRALTTEGSVGIWGVTFLNGRLYAADMLNGLWVVDAQVLQR